jgi:hypothetical protein
MVLAVAMETFIDDEDPGQRKSDSFAGSSSQDTDPVARMPGLTARCSTSAWIALSNIEMT